MTATANISVDVATTYRVFTKYCVLRSKCSVALSIGYRRFVEKNSILPEHPVHFFNKTFNLSNCLGQQERIRLEEDPRLVPQRHGQCLPQVKVYVSMK